MAFQKALKKISSFLEQLKQQKRIQYCLIGGAAVSSWGAVRATADLDFWILLGQRISPREIADGLKRISSKCEIKEGDVDDPIPILINGVIDGIPVQLIIVTRTWEEAFMQSSTSVKVEGRAINILGLEELIILKIWAGGPQDLVDAKRLLELKPDMKQLKRRAKQAGVHQELIRLIP